jgi:endoglucanase
MRRRISTAVLAIALGLLASVTPALGTTAADADTLTPLPPPGAPVATSITDTSATVSWTSGGGPVFRYQVFRLVDGAWQPYTITPGMTSVQLSNLTPGTSYTLAVVAYPGVQPGFTASPMSAPGSFTTLTAGSTPPPPPAGITCTASFSVYPGGFTASVTLTNTGTTPVNGWVVTFTEPANMQVTQAWNVTATISGRSVTLGAAAWNAAISTGGSVNFGFAGTYTGTFVPPTDMKAGGIPCTVTVG